MVSWKVTTELHLNCSRHDPPLWLSNDVKAVAGNLQCWDDFVSLLILRTQTFQFLFDSHVSLIHLHF